jgi:hypothetical protein
VLLYGKIGQTKIIVMPIDKKNTLPRTGSN